MCECACIHVFVYIQYVQYTVYAIVTYMHMIIKKLLPFKLTIKVNAVHVFGSYYEIMLDSLTVGQVSFVTGQFLPLLQNMLQSCLKFVGQNRVLIVQLV